LITSICFFSGVIVSVLGIVGLYIGKIFEGIKNRPPYLIQKKSSYFMHTVKGTCEKNPTHPENRTAYSSSLEG
jgi:hypothetical protein